MRNNIKNHKLDYAVQKPSPNYSGKINPKFIVMHYTAGWSDSSAINTFQSSSSRVSAHVTVGTAGDVYQHVPFNVRAWHAGASEYAGYTGLNKYSIGIEIVNPGYLVKVSGGYKDSIGDIYSAEKVGPVVKSKYPRVGGLTYYWPMYTDQQLNAVSKLTKELIAAYGIIDIVSHEEIDTRGWKTDPGPAFPMNRFKKLLGGRDSDADTFSVTANSLNVRSGPGAEFGIIEELPKNSDVTSYAKRGDWVRISRNGWVHGAYLKRIG